ncbi:MAG: 4-amino-4-deoxychorismate lyase [Paraglaciecola sp.]|jgi:4-amino-4-deoxychorismate lyase
MIVNGQPQTQLNIADRALQYGDGCFTTLAVRHGRAELWAEHLIRLKLSCARLHIVFSDWNALHRDVKTLIKDQTEVVLKIIISRGEGGRGYGVLGVGQPSYILSLYAMPQHYQQWQGQGIDLGHSPIKLARQPLLAGIKHLNRLEQVLIKYELEQSPYLDAVVCDTDNMMVETSAANLFWRQGPLWFTPQLLNSGVEGLMRNVVMDIFKQNAVAIQAVSAGVSSLQQAQEVFICNSLMGVVPIKSFTPMDTSEKKNFVFDQLSWLQTLVSHRLAIQERN